MRRALLIGLLAGAVAAPASATESTIVPGVGIGKVRLGMTLAQVKHVLGPSPLVNKRTELSGHRGYIEYGWNFNTWRVGFLNTHGQLHAALIGYGLRAQRMANGTGVGTPYETLKRKLPVTCLTGREGEQHPYRDPSFQTSGYCVLGGPSRRTTVFTISCRVSGVFYCPGYRVFEVIVRTSF